MSADPFDSTRFAAPHNDDLIDFPIGDLYRNWCIARGLIEAPHVRPNLGYTAIRYPFDTPTDEVWFAEHSATEVQKEGHFQPPRPETIPHPEQDLTKRYRGEI